MAKRSRCGGWTMVEAMVGLAIVGVMASTAGPSLKGLVETSYRESFASEVTKALWLARSEAIKRNGQVVLCKAATTSECSPHGSWDQGWVAFHDHNHNARLDVGEPLVLRSEGLPAGWRLSGNGPVSQYVAYRSLGQTRLASGGFQAGTFTLCRTSTGATTAVRIIINSMGRPRTEKVSVASC